MNKPNNIQDRIKLLMEYDTSKTYSENKELINEATLPPWASKIIEYLKNRYFKFVKTPDDLKKVFIQNWTKKYSNPESVAKSLKTAGNNDLSSKIDEILVVVSNIEVGITKNLAIIENTSQAMSGEAITTSKNNLSKLVEDFFEENGILFANYAQGLQTLKQINAPNSPNIRLMNYYDKIDSLQNIYKSNNFQITTTQEFTKIKKQIDIIYKNFNDEFFANTNTPLQQQWSLYVTSMGLFRLLGDITLVQTVWSLLRRTDTFIRKKDRLKPIINTYCRSYGRACAGSSSNFCKYSKIVGENLKQNQLILLYTLIYGVLTKKPILSDTTSQEFCSLLVKYNVSDVEFNKEEKYLRNSILRSLSEYKTTNRYLYELFIKVWVKNKQIVINSNVTDYLYEKAKTFITSNISLDESKLLPTDFKRTLNEQQPKPNQQQQAHQSSASAAALAGLGLGAKKYGPRLMSFLKKIHEKSKGKIYGIGGMIAAILKYTNISENVWDWIVSVISATESKAFKELFTAYCGNVREGKTINGITYTHKRNQNDASLNLYIDFFNDRTFMETYITDLNKNTINMALWAIFGDYIKGTNLFTMSDLCYINAKTNGEFVNEFQKFYNNLHNLSLEQFKSSGAQNRNAFVRAWKRFEQAPWAEKFNKIIPVLIGEKNADNTYKSELRNELSGMKKVKHTEMINHYLKGNIKTNTNNLGGETWG
jgi:hypothetical protein